MNEWLSYEDHELCKKCRISWNTSKFFYVYLLYFLLCNNYNETRQDWLSIGN